MKAPPSQGILPQPFHLLVVEDSPIDFHLLVRHVKKGWPDLTALRVETAQEMRQAIQEQSWDAVVADVHLPNFSAEHALAIHKELCGHLPFIALSGVVSEEKAVGLLKAGAHDFVSKQNLSRLIPAVEREVMEARERLQRRQAEEELREREEQFRSVAESASDAIISANSQGEIIFWNQAARRIFGYEAEEALGSPLTLLMPERYRSPHQTAIKRVIEEGKTRLEGKKVELAAVRKDGTEFPIEISLSTWSVRKERFFSAIIADITERKHYQNSLTNLVASAQAANQAKSDFLSHMSHEIRTPMNVILGMSDMLSEMNIPDDGVQYVKVLKQAGEGLLHLINNILELSKIEAGEVVIHEEPFDLLELMAGTVSILHTQAKGKGVALTLRMDHENTQIVRGDCHRLREVLLNLLGNAIKFTEQGNVVLEVLPREGDSIHFKVMDQGIGIAPEKLGFIFQPFAQADASTTRRYGGTGLGLTICQQLVERMGGRMGVESTVGQGSTFHVTLPLPLVDGAENERLNEMVSKDGYVEEGTACDLPKGMRILLAEDAKDNSLLVRAFLKGSPHCLTVVENGQEAWEKMQSDHFDLVLMDMQMPVMDGYQATRKIRSWESCCGRPRVPIVALTANAMREDAQQSLNVGCDFHLSKPVLKKQLLRIIQRFAASS